MTVSGNKVNSIIVENDGEYKEVEYAPVKPLEEMTKEELLKEKEGLEAEYKKFQQRGLKLDMSRGKPSQEQLDLSMGMMDVLTSGVDLTCDDGTDCRNYGVLDGISAVSYTHLTLPTT